MFSCKRCGYSTKFKYNLKTHLQRKHVCKPILEDITIEILLNEIQPKEEPSYRCNVCNKPFTKPNNKYRHQKTCKPIYFIQNKQIQKQLTKLTKEIDKLQSTLSQSGSSSLEAPTAPETTINIDHLEVNNNIQLTINLNNFVDTSVESFGSVEAFLDSLKLKLNDKLSFPGIVKDVYFNSAYPENNNIKFIDQDASFIYQDNEWIEEKTLQAISTITKGLLTHMKNKSTVEGAKIQWYFSNNPSEKYDFMTNMKILEEAKNKKIKDNDNLWLDIIEMLCNISKEYYKDLILDYQPQTKEIEFST